MVAIIDLLLGGFGLLVGIAAAVMGVWGSVGIWRTDCHLVTKGVTTWLLFNAFVGGVILASYCIGELLDS